MILDSSAVVAIVQNEQTSELLLERIAAASVRRISAANLLESYTVVDRSAVTDAARRVDRFLIRFKIGVEAVTIEQIVIARDAFHRYGKGSGHPAGLNFGDCFAYALARFHDEPLLFVGHDFAATDIVPALPSPGG